MTCPICAFPLSRWQHDQQCIQEERPDDRHPELCPCELRKVARLIEGQQPRPALTLATGDPRHVIASVAAGHANTNQKRPA